MSMSNPSRHAAALLLLLLPLPALAMNAMTLQAVNMRSGPDRAFPLVTWLPARAPVRVMGCTNGWRWCDVSSGRNRGWVDARYLSNSVRGRAPIVRFSPERYWDQHYRGRPWYADRSNWINWWAAPSFGPPPSPPAWRPGMQPSRQPPASPGRPPSG
ncbi:SH3 domain-containing protein [Variovorax sp. J22P240]|uniref:SH3 domain-containing protein n=1 Tax=unclassified Variovorax TaxID=663243 RepID=UPI002574C4CF|nr:MULTISPECIES: SH3 domain-containing protein [unclassified Variovorax]MDL9999122.1 SH3 domain-containing protein [Variovorax sp. J22P240]MDM0052692.1 SH3 domain-containing protein [Variovorax sp. J22R115]